MEASRFLAATSWMWTEQKVTVEVPEREGRRKSLRTKRTAIPHVSLLDEASSKTDCSVGLESVPVEQDGKVCHLCTR